MIAVFSLLPTRKEIGYHRKKDWMKKYCFSLFKNIQKTSKRHNLGLTCTLELTPKGPKQSFG